MMLFHLLAPALIGCLGTALVADSLTLQPSPSLARRQENQCLLRHYCSPSNGTFFEVNQTIPVSWSASSPFFTPSSSFSSSSSSSTSVLISLEDPTTHQSIWNKTVPNEQSGTEATKILVTEDMLNQREYRLVNLVVRQAQNTAKTPPSLRVTLAATSTEKSSPSSSSSSLESGDSTPNRSSLRTLVIALIVVASVIFFIVMACIVMALVRRQQRRRHQHVGVLQASSSSSTGTTTTSEKNPLPFNVPVIMVSPPTIRSRLRASIVSLGYTSTNRRRSTASSTSGVTRPPSAVVAATRETSFSIHRSQRTPSTLSYNNSAQDDEKPLASLHRSLS